jgi:hypothetical protein
MLICVCLCILASLRIPDMILGDKPLISEVVLSHRAPSLHVPGADRTQRHPASRPPGHRVPDLCDYPWSSIPGLLLLPWSSSRHTMPHLPPAHHETSKCDSPNEPKIKEKQNKIVPDSNSNLAKSMTHHNQTKELTIWFLRSASAMDTSSAEAPMI